MSETRRFDFETYVIDSLKDIKGSLAEMSTLYVPRTENLLMLKERDDKILAVDSKLEVIQEKCEQEVKKRDARNTAVISAVLGAVLLSLGSLIIALVIKKP